MSNRHTIVMGYYLDHTHVKRRAFLGHTLKEARHRLWYVKNGFLL